MDISNETAPSEFILLAFSHLNEWRFLLLVFMLLTYLLTLMGNALIICIISLEPSLQTPMYFFLSNLSLLDLCQTSTTIAQIIVHLISGQNNISYKRCKMQVFFFLLFIGTESLLLAVMAYDRYAAICNPLRYHVVMNKRMCSLLVSTSWFTSSLNATLHTVFTFYLSFCGVNEINYFYCDISPLLAISCGELFNNIIAILAASPIMGFGPAMCILISYIRIIWRILKMNSSTGMKKAFSTCASHLTVVLLFFGSCIFMYIRPISNHSLNNDIMIALFNNILSPMLNPLIYTLRNKDVKEALKKILVKKLSF
ncbi:Olfactory receptor 5V1 [Varanus komodoensis]|uniref:olfactory receptor 5V1-like n=1 Tax=Varanus komodoensis TaxID=61221 RepID=UPI001CF769A0|nr:olfactory receptor 5V1-like [Varanus komodoensis]KAF7237970.1 Olfactory receptor 5V1 [Varanus komodoensis]